jgi:hypothetical protein
LFGEISLLVAAPCVLNEFQSEEREKVGVVVRGEWLSGSSIVSFKGVLI